MSCKLKSDLTEAYFLKKRKGFVNIHYPISLWKLFLIFANKFAFYLCVASEHQWFDKDS